MYQKKNMSVLLVILLLDRFFPVLKGKTRDHRPRWCGHQKNFFGNGVRGANNGSGGVCPRWLAEGFLADRERGDLEP